MKHCQSLILSLILVAGMTSAAAAYSLFEVYADTTMGGQAGFLMTIADSSDYYDEDLDEWIDFLELERFFMIEEAGHARFYAFYDPDTSTWIMADPGYYLGPAPGEIPGNTWSTLPDDWDRASYSTLDRIENRVVPAGTFISAICIIRPTPPAADGPDVTEYRHFSLGVGMIFDSWTADGWEDELINYSVVGGTGYFPLAVGNWWEFAGSESGLSGTADTPLAINLLHGNYPNPFNPATAISFEMSSAGSARLTIYDAAGHLVRTLIDGQRGAGRQTVTWNGRDDAGRSAAAGVYLYRFEAGRSVQTRSMTLVK